jgi:hypothetical protein
MMGAIDLTGVTPSASEVNQMVDKFLAPLYRESKEGDFHIGRPPSDFQWEFGSEEPLKVTQAQQGQWYLMSNYPSMPDYRLFYLIRKAGRQPNWELLCISQSDSRDLDISDTKPYGRDATDDKIGYVGTLYQGDNETWDEWIWSSADSWSPLGKGLGEGVRLRAIGIVNWRMW